MSQGVKKTNNGEAKSGEKVHSMNSPISSLLAKDCNKKLSFFPDDEDSNGASSSDSNPAQLVTNAISTGVDDKILTSAIRTHKLRKEINDIDKDDASSTGSCSCEDHSSVAAKSDDDPHGNLDYDEDSITDSPSNDNQQSASLDDTTAQPNSPSLENFSNINDSQQSKVQDSAERLTNDGDSVVKDGNKLKSFIRINCDDAEDGSEVKSSSKTTKDRSHKSYHGLLKYFFKDACYFQIKSINHENVEISKSMGIWSTPLQNEIRLNTAFRDHRNVILIFSVQQSGAFQGFARMTSEARPYDRPIPWVLPERLNRANLGGMFNVEWLCTKELSFMDTRDLHNPMNDNKPIKVARDGQQVDPEVARKLCLLFPRDSKRQLIKSIDILKAQARKTKQNIQSRVGYYPMNDLRSFKGGNMRGQHPMPPQLYHPLMNGYHMVAEHSPSHANYHQQLAPYHAFAPAHDRSNGRRRGEQSRKVRGAHIRHPSHYLNQDMRPANYYTNGPDFGPAHPLGDPLAQPSQGINPTIMTDSHNGMFLSHHYYAPYPLPSYHQHPLRPPYEEHWSAAGLAAGLSTTRYHPYQRGTRH